MVNLALWELAGPPVQQALQVPKVPPELQPGDHLESWDQMVHMAPLGRMEIQGNEAFLVLRVRLGTRLQRPRFGTISWITTKKS